MRNRKHGKKISKHKKWRQTLARASNRKAVDYDARHPISDGDWPLRFLDLPPEIRNHIYAFYFTSEDCGTPGIWKIEVRDEDDISLNFYDGFDNDNTSMSALLQTCRQIYQEAKILPYHCNVLHFSNPRDLVEFIGQIDLDVLYAISSIEVLLDEGELDSWCWGMLKVFPKLEVLRLIVPLLELEYYTSNGDNEVSRKIKDLKGPRDLEIVPDDDGEDDLTVEQRGMIRQLRDAWRPFVTQARL